MSEADWEDTSSPHSQAIESGSDEEARRGSARTISTQDDENPETPGDHQHTEPLELGRELSPEEVKRKSSNPEVHQSALSHGFGHMSIDELEANKPPALPAEPTRQAHFPNQYPHEPGHGRYSSPAAPDLPDLHAAGDERRPNVRNPVSDTWRDDAYEKLDREGVTKMSDIGAKQDRWKCENCGFFNEGGKGVCKKCGDRIALGEFQYDPRGTGECGMRFNAMGVKFHKVKRDIEKEKERKESKVEEGEAAGDAGVGGSRDMEAGVEEPETQEPEVQEPETQESEVQEPGVQEPGVQEPEVDVEEVSLPEIALRVELEVQPEIEEPQDGETAPAPAGQMETSQDVEVEEINERGEEA